MVKLFSKSQNKKPSITSSSPKPSSSIASLEWLILRRSTAKARDGTSQRVDISLKWTSPSLSRFPSTTFPSLSNDRTSLPHTSHRMIWEATDGWVVIPNPLSPTLMASINVCPRRFIDTQTLQLVEFEENSFIPPYAIISHIWNEGEEILYDEFIEPREKTSVKQGYWKIMKACRQALQDGIRYIWLDTCCIEREKHEDVAENVSLVYAYYQNAEVCYVYMADVEEKEDMFGKQSTLEQEGTSQWFRCGWTLQQLIAPRTVIFFDKFWRQIGDKETIRDEISRITSICPTVLSNKQSIRDVDVLTRMSWATVRSTTREQDEAYCLQGLLGVTIEPNYDEHRYASFNRLGKALFDAQPWLKERLGIEDGLFSDPNSQSFYNLLCDRFWTIQMEFSPAYNLDE
ncbi:hypothetical protein VKT23_015721 [Stygiomarasmius scandens]|uniref:Heterokaryon incompatibility domain-containing protein n=1 Tax=Marasmiellus scandens TaxID=2682957 RepID=A0ABR1IX31_9AGAR